MTRQNKKKLFSISDLYIPAIVISSCFALWYFIAVWCAAFIVITSFLTLTYWRKRPLNNTLYISLYIIAISIPFLGVYLHNRQVETWITTDFKEVLFALAFVEFAWLILTFKLLLMIDKIKPEPPPTKPQRTPISVLFKDIYKDKTKESVGTTTIMFTGSQDKKQDTKKDDTEDRVGAMTRYMNQRKGK